MGHGFFSPGLPRQIAEIILEHPPVPEGAGNRVVGHVAAGGMTSRR
jgi:hypothetical protein